MGYSRKRWDIRGNDGIFEETRSCKLMPGMQAAGMWWRGVLLAGTTASEEIAVSIVRSMSRILTESARWFLAIATDCKRTKIPVGIYWIVKLLVELFGWLFLHFSVDKKNQLDVTFCILYFSSISCSTCFGQPCAHHQELTIAWCYSLVLVCAVAAGRLSRPVGR